MARCECISQSKDMTVQCQKDGEHDGPHEWRSDNRVKLWFGNVKTPVTDMRWRFESPESLARRCGVFKSYNGGVHTGYSYAPMTGPKE